jgi:hypothetical protein
LFCDQCSIHGKRRADTFRVHGVPLGIVRSLV